MKVVINKCFGGFSLSPAALLRLYNAGVEGISMPIDDYYSSEDDPDNLFGRNTALKKWRDYLANGKPEGRFHFLTVFSPDEKFVIHGGREIERHNPELIKAVEEMGEAANGGCADLKIVEIPDGTDYEIDEYDGLEHIAEKHRTWG